MESNQSLQFVWVLVVVVVWFFLFLCFGVVLVVVWGFLVAVCFFFYRLL